VRQNLLLPQVAAELFKVSFISRGATQLLVGPASCLLSEQI
jgi:hypothetical protein